MKILRLWLLVLLAVLVPLRGAVAAAAVCPDGATHAASNKHLHGHGASTAAMAHAHVAVTAASAQSAHLDHGGGKCSVCCASCTASANAPTFTWTVVPLDASSSEFPRLTAAVPAFVSESPERPPRSI
jgi:hypothetical protein